MLRTAHVVQEMYSEPIDNLPNRHGNGDDPVSDGDVFFLFDGGKKTALGELLKPFAGKS